LIRALPAGSTVWFDAPLPTELRAALLADRDSAAQLTEDRSKAMYVVAGAPSADGISYAWFQRGDLDADIQTPAELGSGCSPDSPFPLRTDYETIANDLPLNATTAENLNERARKLARLNGWFHLQSSATGEDAFQYRLAFQRVDDGAVIHDGDETVKDQLYKMVLEKIPDVPPTLRWVYVVTIDCQGTGRVLWPWNGPAERFPTQNGAMDSIPLPRVSVRISNPLGTDTFLMLTTASPLADWSVLEFSGVVGNGVRGSGTPLEELLGSTGVTARAAPGQTPTDWGIQVLQTHSRPSYSKPTQ
jgi:hypothetical protein